MNEPVIRAVLEFEIGLPRSRRARFNDCTICTEVGASRDVEPNRHVPEAVRVKTALGRVERGCEFPSVAGTTPVDQVSIVGDLTRTELAVGCAQKGEQRRIPDLEHRVVLAQEEPRKVDGTPEVLLPSTLGYQREQFVLTQRGGRGRRAGRRSLTHHHRARRRRRRGRGIARACGQRYGCAPQEDCHRQKTRQSSHVPDPTETTQTPRPEASALWKTSAGHAHAALQLAPNAKPSECDQFPLLRKVNSTTASGSTLVMMDL